ncbi:MAG: WXG100 family type VII secretion target [Clostridia bacterium]|nr:WXG100 family type VII secretion target [Clostridia bacterium]
MAAANFSVDAGQFSSYINELEDYRERLRQEINALTDKCNELNGMWEGEAKEKFIGAYGADKEQMVEFYNLLGTYTEALSQILKKFF